MKIQLISAALFIFSLKSYAGPHFGDAATASATQRIVHRLQISKVSDLHFGEASPGDGPLTISPGISENGENASFEIHGEPNRLIQILLPPDNSIKMIQGSGGQDKEIIIKEFLSFPSRKAILDGNGRAMIFVGAKRDAISAKQNAGDYAGQFVITVIY
ncbi:DUF4402 domain-containing protein [Bdellovibrio bacteriovorus]|uniref:DUF4402 domain-containing protein n=1 Tax=Bdellovibrio bacteriovorus TaxID=959 RepID=UPI0035A58C86